VNGSQAQVLCKWAISQKCILRVHRHQKIEQRRECRAGFTPSRATSSFCSVDRACLNFATAEKSPTMVTDPCHKSHVYMLLGASSATGHISVLLTFSASKNDCFECLAGHVMLAVTQKQITFMLGKCSPATLYLALRSYLGNRGTCGVIAYSGCTDARI
jgi:hypothetical protein